MRFWILPLLICLLGCKSKEPPPIIIGEFSSLTGSESTFGRNTHQGIQLAIDEANKEGGIQGRPIRLVTKNNQSQIDQVPKVINELIHEDKVLAIIGEVASQRTLTAAPIAQANNIPLITPASTNPNVTKVGPFIFRVCYIDPFQGYVMAKFARENLKLSKVAILKDMKSEYSTGLAEFFTNTFTKLGGKIVADQTYNTGDIDFKDQLTHIRRFKPEALFLPGYYTEVGLIARQVKQLGLKVTLLGGDGWDSPKLFEIGREAINGGYFSNHFTAESSESHVLKFVKSYRKRYKSTPDGLAASAYDATKLLFQAIKSAKEITPVEVQKQLTRIKKFPGVTGLISINSNRDAIKPAVVLKVDGPINRYVTTINP